MVNNNNISIKFINLAPHGCFYASGKVVHGFGRGSKQLGVPTGKYRMHITYFDLANLEESLVLQLSSTFENGIYFGWAKEVHILNEFDNDFYDEWLQIVALKYDRPEKNFDSLDDLIKQIHLDIQNANAFLDQDEAQQWRHSPLFLSCGENGTVLDSK